MRQLKTKISITLDDDIIPEIKELAIADERSFSQYINMVLRKYLRKYESDPESTSQSLLQNYQKNF